ncbi:MAG: hypothetical protein KAT32_02485 [Candidatus Moranbacteria bacterium]|nr:hypothetical protein [Candidatus Moranbacteria bacterium]
MIKILEFFKDIIISKSEEQDDFADFFLRASSKEKKKVFKRVIRKANKDQKKYIERYEKMQMNK